MPSLVVSSGSFHSRLTRVVPTFEVLRPQAVPGSLREMITTSLLKKTLGSSNESEIKARFYMTILRYEILSVSKSNF